MVVVLAVMGLFAVAVVALAFVASQKPDSMRVERSIVINAPAERVYALLADFHEWTKWSPWEHIDPQMRRTYSGAESGVGAKYAWEGNGKVGQGSMEITEVERPSRVTLKLDFLKPMEAHNMTDFTIAPTDGGVRLLWAMHGPQPFTSKVFATLVDMDKMIGRDFERGLANIKSTAESAQG